METGQGGQGMGWESYGQTTIIITVYNGDDPTLHTEQTTVSIAIATKSRRGDMMRSRLREARQNDLFLDWMGTFWTF